MATQKKASAPKKKVSKKNIKPTSTGPTKKTKATSTATKAKAPAKPKTVANAKPNKTLKVRGKSPKEIATSKGEPYIAILNVELDPDNIGNGAFELDWNDKFVANLVRAGYQIKPGEEDNVIVDRWFQEVCRNVAAENFEQWEANQPYAERPRVINRKDIGDGKIEVS